MIRAITKDSKPGAELSPELREWIRKDTEKRLRACRITLDKLIVLTEPKSGGARNRRRQHLAGRPKG